MTPGPDDPTRIPTIAPVRLPELGPVAMLPRANLTGEVPLDAAFLSQGAAAMRTVARVAVALHRDGAPVRVDDEGSVGTGTAFLVDPAYALTACHVVWGGLGAPLDADLTLQLASTTLAFHDGPVVTGVTLVAWSPPEADDFALLRLPRTLDAAPCPVRWNPVRTGRAVNVLHYPYDDRLYASLRNNACVGVAPDRLHYLASTESGSSGAPLFDDDWWVTGWHRGVDPIANVGTPIARVRAALDAARGAPG